jgi:5-methylcytosine-specific restriction endonuclease McrBC GTP-binding regulatory subunit McrB
LQDVYAHPLVEAKASVSVGKTPKHTVRARIQQHCLDVTIKDKLEPQIFRKDENRLWSIEPKLIEQEAPDLLNKVKDYRDFQPTKKGTERFIFTTFHQSMGYEDFIEGIKPIIDEETEQIKYEVTNGIFLDIAEKAKEDPHHNYAIFIDEINRGNVSSIFGELITLIEKDKRKNEKNELSCTLTYSKRRFSVPPNLYIIGTMNTADRSVEALDTALRRRFSFVELTTDTSQLPRIEQGDIDLAKMVDTINTRIEYLLDKDHLIGHAYFLDIAKAENPTEALKETFARNILPLLQEYFYGQPYKIGLVLGDQFVEAEKSLRKPNQVFHRSFKPDDVEEKTIYRILDPMTFEDLDPFRNIYEE